MAFAVSITSSVPLNAAKFSSKELLSRKAPPETLLSLATVRTESSLLHCYSTRDILPMRARNGDSAPFDHFGELPFCCAIVNSSTHRTISGYWEGPDIDDGWGFVEAFVNQVT